MAQDVTPSSTNKNRLQFSLDYRLISGLLLVVILGMLLSWKPWASTNKLDESRTIKVTGETKLTAEPDEYTFSPNYEFKNTDKQAALNTLTAKSEEVVKKLKELGIADSKIKINADGNNYDYYYDQNSRQSTYSLRLTVVAGNRDQAQKIQDYLITTSPLGAVSPYANFSEAKKKELQSKARDEATKDARSKAEQSAKNLGFKLDKVKSVEDGTGFGNISYPLPAIEKVMDSAGTQRLGVQPGENDLSYSVTVVYYFR